MNDPTLSMQQLSPLAATTSPAMTTSHQTLPASAHASSIQASVELTPGSSRINYPDFLATPSIPPRKSSNRNHHDPYDTTATPSSEKISAPHNGKPRADGRNSSRREKTADNTNSTNKPRREDMSRGAERPSTQGQTAAPNYHRRVAMETTPGQGTLVKESSTVINQVAISDALVDIDHDRTDQTELPSPSLEAPPASFTSANKDREDDGGRAVMRSHGYDGNSAKRKQTSFGQFILGQTLGEGEFGKVKLGWKKDGSLQVAIKLIRREVLGSNPSRLPKIYREISILRDLSHPNIVRLHEMVETDRHIGIIMEYASGGELFDHILSNRYLKDNAARRLFAQLVSGVGYLHKKGIVHRDLKLENLLLDRNRNIIITDFGFANTFDPSDKLEEEIEYNLTNKEYVRKMRLDKPNAAGFRRGDLMQTSCGSPCYAAPELVVSDSLYTGCKVDVWSCGVILYAMLAGYLPFDDDPANPDGDNINLLYKYIVSTPLTFPEYVTPHARDVLRRILVPDPRKRADLFEVARHSWLGDYAHVVSHITSNASKTPDIASSSSKQHAAEQKEAPALARSASVREPPRPFSSALPTVGGLNHQSGNISQEQQSQKVRASRDAKRRTVQVEYVAPQSQTVRGEAILQEHMAEKHMARSDDWAVRTTEPPRSGSDVPTFTGPRHTAWQSARPATGGSMASFNAGRLPSRGSYGQPVAPTVAATNAEGRLAQPKSRQYGAPDTGSHSISQAASNDVGHPSAQQLPPKFNTTPRQGPPKGHKRSSTVSGIGEKLFGRPGSLFGSRTAQPGGSRVPSSGRHPPTSMKEPSADDETRTSMDSRRSDYRSNHKPGEVETRQRRFSLLPPSFSLRGIATSRSQTSDEEPQVTQTTESRTSQHPSSDTLRPRPRATTYVTQDPMNTVPEGPSEEPGHEVTSYESQVGYEAQSGYHQGAPYGSASTDHVPPAEQGHYDRNLHADQLVDEYYGERSGVYNDQTQPSVQSNNRTGRPGVLQKNRKFADAYEYERNLPHQAGSSGAARKVMDFFRRRAKSRAGDER